MQNKYLYWFYEKSKGKCFEALFHEVYKKQSVKLGCNQEALLFLDKNQKRCSITAKQMKIIA